MRGKLSSNQWVLLFLVLLEGLNCFVVWESNCCAQFAVAQQSTSCVHGVRSGCASILERAQCAASSDCRVEIGDPIVSEKPREV